MNLEKILNQKTDKKKSTKISRAAEGLIKAHSESSNLNQHFELLERMLEETSELRKRIPSLKTITSDNNKDRSNLIEKAALELLHANNESGVSQIDIEKLKKALSWKLEDKEQTS